MKIRCSIRKILSKNRQKIFKIFRNKLVINTKGSLVDSIRMIQITNKQVFKQKSK